MAENLDERLRALAAIAPRAGIFCDFDGCLSPIVANPPDARAVRGAPRVLAKLAKRFAVVAVVSGRQASFLAHRLHSRRVRLVGLYGIEERVGRRLRVLSEAQAARASIDRAFQSLRADLKSVPGVWIEHKGFAISVHFRRARDPEAAMAASEPAVRAVAEVEGLAELMRGRLVLELRPPVAMDKGEVVRSLVEQHGLQGALVAGDDTGDIPTFDAVVGLQTVLRLAVASEEAPPELLARADHTLRDPEDFLRVLRTLASLTDR